MALDTYANLKTAIADWLNRSDLSTVADDFIDLAEAEFNRVLRVRQMVTRSSVATISSQYTSLPTGFLEFHGPIALVGTSPQAKLTYVTPEEADNLREREYYVSGQPAFYTIAGDELEAIPTPDASYTARWRYYAAITALSGSATTNWLLTKHPDLYLYGSLLQAAPYLKDDQRLVTWSTLYDKALNQARLEDERATFSGSTPTVRTRGFE